MDILVLSLFFITMFSVSGSASAQLIENYYAEVCPDVEKIVGTAVSTKFSKAPNTVPATIRLFFHDCFVSGCDASVIIASTPGNTAEKDHPDNLSLAGDGFDTVTKAKAAVDAVPHCRNKVSCADILALAARDAIVLGGGPWFPVELGRLDGLVSTAVSVDLPHPSFNLDQLTEIFASRGLSQTDMIALSGAHTVGFSFCNRFANRLYNFSDKNPIDPTLDRQYAAQLRATCPFQTDPENVADLDPTTPAMFDNAYFRNLVQGKGLLSSDQILFTDLRSRNTVSAWASDPRSFNKAFIQAITKLGRVGVKTRSNGNIRFDCARFNDHL